MSWSHTYPLPPNMLRSASLFQWGTRLRPCAVKEHPIPLGDRGQGRRGLLNICNGAIYRKFGCFEVQPSGLPHSEPSQVTFPARKHETDKLWWRGPSHHAHVCIHDVCVRVCVRGCVYATGFSSLKRCACLSCPLARKCYCKQQFYRQIKYFVLK